jgi:hypothetical protein
MATPDPVASRRRVLAWALSQVGTIERSPRGEPTGDDERIDGWQREFGLTAAEWCGCFVGYGLRVVAGIDEIDDRIVWVPFVPEDARDGRHGWLCLVPAAEAVPGDVAVFCWDASAVPEHVGFVTANDRSRRIIATVEGNTTSGDDGDQSHGGGVFSRERSYDAIVTCARPRYP